MWNKCILLFFTIFYIFSILNISNAEESHWRLKKALLLPNWVSITGEHRSRYEYLDHQFRAGSTGSDQVLSLRTLIQSEFQINGDLKIKLEMQDARGELNDNGSRINPTIVNSAELLEANIVWKTKNLFYEGSQSFFRGGRLTLDIGSRRFIARNRFRNVIQAFTGIDWNLAHKNGNQVRILFTLPVNRRPTDTADLLKNHASFDEESLNRILWSVFFTRQKLLGRNQGELYLFGLHEKDGSNFNTRNRQIYTPGFRFLRPPKEGEFDYELESMFQFGYLRATNASTDITDLDHFAYFYHAAVGFTFNAIWSPRLFLEYDYASGDDDPNDNKNERFERQFGPNVPEFGPTSIHTAFVRANINSPGVRLQIRPNPFIFSYLSYRSFWLASDTDGWRGASGLRDRSGNSGSFLGHQLFLRIKWKTQSNYKFEGGLAYRINGDFQKNATNSPRQGNSVYSYISTTVSF